MANDLSAKSEPNAGNLDVLAQATGLPLVWVISGKNSGAVDAEPRDACHRGPRLDDIPLTREFFERRLHRNPEDMIINDARGESMEPTMRDRDLWLHIWRRCLLKTIRNNAFRHSG